MTIAEFDKHQKELFDKLITLTEEKSKEYNTTEKRFDHFVESAGLSLHNEKESVSWEFCVKHLQSVRDIIKHVEDTGNIGDINQQRLDEKFGDIIVYMTLMHGMLTKRLQDGIKEQE